jgi:hypothetical protein
MDSAVKGFGSESENCRRKKLLQAVGSSEMIHSGNLCCDGCVGDGLPLRLQFEKTSPIRTCSKRRVAAYDVSDDMKSRIKANLVRERDAYMQSHPHYYMSHYSFVCPDCVIDHICEQARFIKSEEDLDVIGLRPELKSIFFAAIISIVSSAPPAKRTRRTFR